MSRLYTYFVTVQSGSDIVESLRSFTVKQNLKAAFLVHCSGLVNKATIRLSEAKPGFEPVKEVTGTAQINSLVGTLSEGSHLHISLTDNHSECVGGHVFGPLVACGIVNAIVGECVDLLFERLPDRHTGYRELAVRRKRGLDGIIAEQLHSAEKEHDSPRMAANELEAIGGSGIKVFALRLGPGEDIVERLNSLVTRENLKAAFIMTCVGSVTNPKIRLAHQPSGNKVVDLAGYYEIVSFVGTLPDTAHLHISLSDKDGHVFGGHVLENLTVYTTAEIVVGECTDYSMTREMDARTGYPELVVKKS